jgi:hypothetical protein
VHTAFGSSSTVRATAGNVRLILIATSDSDSAAVNELGQCYDSIPPRSRVNSGGPLLDTSGHLVGIVTGKLNAMRLAPILGDVPQNVNFALKAEVARTFLDSKGIAYQTARSEQQLSPADVGDIARPFTVLIECEEANSRPAAGPEPQPRTEVQYRASMNLNLRISPDVSSANLLGAWSPDYIPEGTMFVGQPRCILQGAGAGWCKITFKHRNGIVTIGWVNGWYLEKMP